jgi:putative ABC transport system substrate-binding protein
MASVGDPVGDGLIVSLARPGGNVTGLTSMNFNLGGKSLDVLKDIVPKLDHVAILSLVSRRAAALFVKNTGVSAPAMKIKLTTLMVRGPEDYESVFRTAIEERAQALIVGGTPQTSAVERKQIIELAAKSRLPAIYDTRDWVDNGGLISYGADRVEMYRRAAVYVDKIFKGAKPAELPVEQPTKFELVINLRTAKKLGLTMPQSLLLSADKVID